LSEAGFAIHPAADTQATSLWVHEFVLHDPDGARLRLDSIKAPLEAAFLAIWSGQTECDGLNRLVLELGLSWREVALIRCLARYRQQSGLDPSQTVQEAALCENPGLTRQILDLFLGRFDPALHQDCAQRSKVAKASLADIILGLQQVESLDHDRVLRRLAHLVMAVTRTNYFQTQADGQAKPYISVKIASRELEDLPAPKPYREIYVWSPRVEGIHLRFGPVARGGLRWSDRRDDFRTEVLGLVKAQQVKNAVIVPVGSKGGFFPKALPRDGGPDAVREEAIRAYKIFLSGLLDITDNLAKDGAVKHPDRTLRYDGDDPYLVVAADKGTATFSDIANGVAADYRFWLGDAFASGGSVGYDHKAMGITARGAWEAVKRHFREMNRDIQTEPFSVVGVGDMSGDVFGNGMLLSKQTRLIAAFDHRHVFIDPDPDPSKSWKERQRLFGLPRSSWADYNPDLISTGGGVFARNLKSVALTPEIRAIIGSDATELTPTDLIKALLQAKVDLLYLGGIGTYVKAADESHAQVGDKANDAVRVDADRLNCLVIGEGANLGLTQAARIRFAIGGGRINTDAIDNSAGVDCSDHEVNIKILTDMAQRAGHLNQDQRNALLASMTDAVAEHVLADNIGQTLALSLQERSSAADLESHEQFMRQLEAAGRLDRLVEGLPSTAVLAARGDQGMGLTRPELAVIMAYGKLELSEAIVASEAWNDPWFEQTLEGYFPPALLQFKAEMSQHRLRPEIIATVLANELVNRLGPSFAPRLMSATGVEAKALILAFTAAREILGHDQLWAQIAAPGAKIPGPAQLALLDELALVLRRQTYWLARRAGQAKTKVEALLSAYGPVAEAVSAQGLDLLSEFDRQAAHKRIQVLTDQGAPKALAKTVGSLRNLTPISDIADLARRPKWAWLNTARLYHQVGAQFGLDRLRAAAGSIKAEGPFERMAIRRLIEDLMGEQSELTAAIMGFAGNEQAADTGRSAQAAVASWSALRIDKVKKAQDSIAQIEAASGPWTFAKLTLANSALREVITKA
jgi:glutamate dehydrogenase